LIVILIPCSIHVFSYRVSKKVPPSVFGRPLILTTSLIDVLSLTAYCSSPGQPSVVPESPFPKKYVPPSRWAPESYPALPFSSKREDRVSPFHSIMDAFLFPIFWGKELGEDISCSLSRWSSRLSLLFRIRRLSVDSPPLGHWMGTSIASCTLFRLPFFRRPATSLPLGLARARPFPPAQVIPGPPPPSGLPLFFSLWLGWKTPVLAANFPGPLSVDDKKRLPRRGVMASFWSVSSPPQKPYPGMASPKLAFFFGHNGLGL